MAAQLEVESGKIIKVNLSQASELIAAFENIKANITAFNKIEPAAIAQAIIKYRAIDRVKNLAFLTKLRCGIGKTELPMLVDRLMY